MFRVLLTTFFIKINLGITAAGKKYLKPFMIITLIYCVSRNTRILKTPKKELAFASSSIHWDINIFLVRRITLEVEILRPMLNGGVALYSKFPLIDSARIKMNREPHENFIYADILFNKRPLRIFTARLQSFELYTDTAEGNYSDDNIYEITYKRRKATQYKIRETEVKHQKEVSVIRKAIDKSPYPVIYCGDLNTTPTSYNYRYLRGRNLQDAFLEKGSGIGNTFYKLGPTLRIDVCFADTSLQVLQCTREKKELSDHYHVITDIKWKHQQSKYSTVSGE